MLLEAGEITKLRFVDSKYDYQDFEVTALNYTQGAHYECENGHVGAEPALLIDSSAYNPSDGRFDISGTVVYVCPVCKTPVVEYSE